MPDGRGTRAAGGARRERSRLPRSRPASAGLAALLLAVAPAHAQSDEATLEGWMGEADIPGLSIALVANGDIVWDAALGAAHAETGEPVTAGTVFEAASLTKPVVAYAALRLVERGVLDLDRPLWEVLSYPRLEHDERGRAITPRHVLAHTSGLPNWGGTPLEMERGPGERWGYSGEGFVYLQRVLERLTGIPLAELVDREVFEPLGMASSSLVWRPDYDRIAATGHDLIALPVEKGRPAEANAAASLHTTARDYARFLIAVLQGRGLEGSTVVSMLSPASQVEGRGQAEHSRHLQWGLGWGIQNGDRSNAIWHWGDNGTFRCFVIGYPSQGRGLVYFTNSENGLSIAEEVLSRFFRDSHHSIRWLDYDRWDDPGRRTRIALRRAFLEGPEAGSSKLRALQAESPAMVTGRELGNLAGWLSGRALAEEALLVAEVRAEVAPGADSEVGLAETLTSARRYADALAAYGRAIERAPGRAEDLAPRVAWLEEGIDARREPISLTTNELARYVGDYGPRRIRLEGDRLVYAREGAAAATPLVPLTRELFDVTSSPTFRIRFALGPDGVPTAIVGRYSDGREDETPRSGGS